MSNKATASASGLGFTGALTILFTALKLTGAIDWSWWWVLSPIWISGLFVLLLVSPFLYLGISLLLQNRRRRIETKQ